MLETLRTAFVNPNRVREATIQYRQLMMGPNTTFADFKTQFLLLAEEANIPSVSRRMDLYDKLTADLQLALLPVLSTLTTFNALCTRAIEVDQERKWISQRVQKAKQERLQASRMVLQTSTPRSLTSSSGFVAPSYPATYKVRSTSPQPRVHFADQKPRSPTPPPPSEQQPICFKCGQPGHYASACANPQKASADLKELDQYVSDDSDQGKVEL
jgi:hypothetical protein